MRSSLTLCISPGNGDPEENPTGQLVSRQPVLESTLPSLNPFVAWESFLSLCFLVCKMEMRRGGGQLLAPVF